MQTCNALFDPMYTNTSGVRVAKTKTIRNKCQDKIRKHRATMRYCFNKDAARNRLLIPIVNSHHFFVLCLDFCFNSRNFFDNICFYDSLHRSSRLITVKHTNAVIEIMESVNAFFCAFVLHEKKYHLLHQHHNNVLNRVTYGHCPVQTNGYDCGLFAVIVVLHLVEGTRLNTDTFDQKDISNLRSKLCTVFGLNVEHSAELAYKTTSEVVRNCFPALRGSSIIDTAGVEMLPPVLPPAAASARKIRNKQEEDVEVVEVDQKGDDNVKEDVEVVEEIDEKGNDDLEDDVTKDDDIFMECEEIDVVDEGDNSHDEFVNKASSKIVGTDSSLSTTNSQEEKSEDSMFLTIMKEQNVHCFATLGDVTPIIEAYELRSGNRMAIKRSVNGKFRVYECREHLDCHFQICFSRRQFDGMYGVSTIYKTHSDLRRPPRAADGRNWKKRRHAKLDDIIGQVVRTKQGAPTPADVVKTAATHSGMIIPYMAAYRALYHEKKEQTKESLKDYELIVPYLDALKKCNPGSVIGYTRDDEMRMIDMYFFPNFMNNVLKFVRPVVSLDAAHLKSSHKGTLFVASVLSGNNDVYPIGFLISSGNEDGDTWNKMLCLLKEACPILTEQGFGDFPVLDADGVMRRPFLFVSDRDKGLKPALRVVFPNNHEMSCAKHIEANVAQRYGKQCSRFVCAIAKSSSARYSNRLLEAIRNIKPDAAVYLEDITNSGTLWRSTQWLSVDQGQIPPRYGIVTSNTSESVNNMFADARTVGWVEAAEKIIDIMSDRICCCRLKYDSRDDTEVVPRVAQILKKRWDASAAMSVAELERGCGDFKVVEPSVLAEDMSDHPSPTPNSHGDHSIHIVKPDLQWCSCGVWQDFLFPCRHGCAVFRKCKEYNFQFMLSNLVPAYYKFEYVKKTFTSNVFPACLDGIEHDKVTKPPIVTKRQPGRPKTKRIRRRSELLDPEDSPIVCSLCSKRGHNKRTCPNR